ncbi:hypothetical protein EVA_02007 [gut metagenome]|uniref:Uncharacterized protein n=1 Tax=gut metagenome TaxID=749906 RepID=J9H6V9_9ZZZZ
MVLVYHPDSDDYELTFPLPVNRQAVFRSRPIRLQDE